MGNRYQGKELQTKGSKQCYVHVHLIITWSAIIIPVPIHMH